MAEGMRNYLLRHIEKAAAFLEFSPEEQCGLNGDPSSRVPSRTT